MKLTRSKAQTLNPSPHSPTLYIYIYKKQIGKKKSLTTIFGNVTFNVQCVRRKSLPPRPEGRGSASSGSASSGVSGVVSCGLWVRL